jgi:hypothetical protein
VWDFLPCSRLLHHSASNIQCSHHHSPSTFISILIHQILRVPQARACENFFHSFVSFIIQHSPSPVLIHLQHPPHPHIHDIEQWSQTDHRIIELWDLSIEWLVARGVRLPCRSAYLNQTLLSWNPPKSTKTQRNLWHHFSIEWLVVRGVPLPCRSVLSPSKTCPGTLHNQWEWMKTQRHPCHHLSTEWQVVRGERLPCRSVLFRSKTFCPGTLQNQWKSLKT